MKDSYTYIEFNYASLSLTGYTGEEADSSRLLKNLIQYLNSEGFSTKDKIINRNSGRKNTHNRNLIILPNRFFDSGRKCYGRIALIKNKAPITWSETNEIEVINNPDNKKFIEVTNYLISFEKSQPIIMIEFNNEGPRLSDIEYYFRQISRKEKIAKYIQSTIHLKVEYDRLEHSISNVFSINVKVKSSTIIKQNWLKALRNISEETGYKDVRLEFFYQRTKDLSGKYRKNVRGIDFARNIISWLRRDSKNIENIEDLKMSYQATDNDEEILDLDFLKNKVVSMIKVPLDPNTNYPVNDLKEHLNNEFNIYLTTGKPTLT